MKFLKYFMGIIAIGAIFYLAALLFADPRCKFDRNPFDCDDDVIGPIRQDMRGS